MFSQCLKSSVNLLRRFSKDNRGNFAIIFGLTAVPMIALTGSAIDFNNGLRLKAKMQASLDATALATARYASQEPRKPEDIENYAKVFFSNNFKANEFNNAPVLTVSAADERVSMNATGKADTYFTRLVGLNYMDVGVDVEVVYANRTLDVALVLDNSGSMSRESRLYNVQQAAKKFAAKLFGETTTDHPNLQIGLVPFNHTVNVGSQYANAPWMDTSAQSPIHSENFGSPVNRFTLYSQMTKRRIPLSWPGCVEVRPQPYDVNDYDVNLADLEPEEIALGTPPSAKLFVPWFNQDEPDTGSSKQRILRGHPRNNDYLSDGFKYESSSDGYYTNENRWRERQQNLVKYRGEVSGDGPATDCYVKSILDLEDDLDPINRAIDSMTANGNTNIFQGFMWGWRLVSPGEPFTRGRDPAVDPNNFKYIVLLTDGIQVFGGDTFNPNASRYTAFGYANNNRLQLRNANVDSNRVAAMNHRLARGCENAKKAGVTIFTITYGSDLDRYPDTRELLKNCASQPSYYQHAPKADEADKVFDAVAATITQLYLSK